MPNLLDVDPSIMERNLLFKDLEGLGRKLNDEMSMESLLNMKPKDPGNEVPWKPVKPSPGYCVKLRTEEGDKVFVNVCHTEAIPEPEEISEEKLLQMIMDDDVPSFRIPISIGDLHIESDKSRNPCSVYDIAVNSSFYKKMDSSEVFNTFFLNVSIQALQEKYTLGLDLKSEKPFLLLKNRKSFGNLQVHRIQQREVKKAPGQLIQEIQPQNQTNNDKKLIQVIAESDNKVVKSDKVSSKSTKVNKVSSVKSKNDKNVSNQSKVKKDVAVKNISEINSQSTSLENCNEKTSHCGNLVKNNADWKAKSEEKGVKETRLTKGDLVVSESRCAISGDDGQISVNTEDKSRISGNTEDSRNSGDDGQISGNTEDRSRISGDDGPISGNTKDRSRISGDDGQISGNTEDTSRISGDDGQISGNTEDRLRISGDDDQISGNTEDRSRISGEDVATSGNVIVDSVYPSISQYPNLRISPKNVATSGNSEAERVCPGMLCIRQYPEFGSPQTLIASIHLNIRSSREFSLELNSNRVCVTLEGSAKPWFDITLPYSIDVDSVQARFIKQTQKLMVKMDVMES